jgi:hypothetical protein
MKIMCAGCLEPFEQKRKSQVYCSDACRVRGYRLRKKMFSLKVLYPICEHCGKRFHQSRQGRNAKYCSQTCRQKAYIQSRKDAF